MDFTKAIQQIESEKTALINKATQLSQALQVLKGLNGGAGGPTKTQKFETVSDAIRAYLTNNKGTYFTPMEVADGLSEMGVRVPSNLSAFLSGMAKRKAGVRRRFSAQEDKFVFAWSSWTKN